MARNLVIDNVRIADDTDCYVVAEVGHNHQGSLEKAKDLFLAARDCGAHAVKLQKRNNRELYTRAMYDSPYDNENSYGRTYGEHREFLEFDRDQYVELQRYAAEIGITMFATAFDFSSADLLAELGIPAFKVASGDLTNTPFLAHLASFGKPLLVSTGGSTMDDVQRAVDTILPVNDQPALLQCTACYPSEPEEMNLRVIENYRTRFPDLVTGLSDHQSGIAMALVGYVLGARIVEKHFTLNRAWKGTDHAFSLERAGLQKLVRDLKRAHAALGDGSKGHAPCEEGALVKMRKKLVAGRDLPEGHVMTREDVAVKSPGDGLAPYELDKIIGRVTAGKIAVDENLSFESFK
jgi:N-acetylneuraminate synthase/sialic acid synthase